MHIHRFHIYAPLYMIMKGLNMIKRIIMASIVLASFNSFADNNNQNLILVNSTKDNQPSLTLTVQNANQISNLKFNGLDKNFSIIGREISFNSSSTKSQSNQFVTKLYLKPIRINDSSISASAKVNNKDINSNTINLNISKQQLDAYNAIEKKNNTQEQLRIKKINQQIIAQMQQQQRFFNNIQTLMQKQETEMLKQQQELIKQFN